MSRFRLSSILAVAAGILITTGGCTASPTASDFGDASMARTEKPVTVTPAPADGEEEEEMATLSSGYIGTGSRQDDVAAP
jgi:hypothetical protein